VTWWLWVIAAVYVGWLVSAAIGLAVEQQGSIGWFVGPAVAVLYLAGLVGSIAILCVAAWIAFGAVCRIRTK
jgi:hypothetical protein